MVGDEADGADEHLLDVAGLQILEVREDVWPQPALDERELRAAADGFLELAAVGADRESRVVRREDEAGDRLGAGGERPLDGLGDPRTPVTHPRVDREAELALERGARSLRDLVE